LKKGKVKGFKPKIPIKDSRPLFFFVISAYSKKSYGNDWLGFMPFMGVPNNIIIDVRTKMALDITVTGEQAGRCKPMVGKDKARQLAVVISVNVVDFLENLLEELCHEKFVV
jgi:hypothetical protein